MAHILTWKSPYFKQTEMYLENSLFLITLLLSGTGDIDGLTVVWQSHIPPVSHVGSPPASNGLGSPYPLRSVRMHGNLLAAKGALLSLKAPCILGSSDRPSKPRAAGTWTV